jgi:hypothetical protein
MADEKHADQRQHMVGRDITVDAAIAESPCRLDTWNVTEPG